MDKRGVLTCIAAACLLTGCASANREKEHEAALARLAHWLPGNYDNTAQSKADIQKGIHPPHDAADCFLCVTTNKSR